LRTTPVKLAFFDAITHDIQGSKFGWRKLLRLMVTDLPNQDATNTTRHAYHTADYKVTQKDMSALYQRYGVWKAAKDKASQREYTSFQTISPNAPGRRAYQTASFDVIAVPVEQTNTRRAYRTNKGHKSEKQFSHVNVTFTGTQSR
jgi:hypothetical protein